MVFRIGPLLGLERNRIRSADKLSRPYIRLLQESIGGPMYNTFFEHRRGCGCRRCFAAYKRYEAIGTLVTCLMAFTDKIDRDGKYATAIHDRELDHDRLVSGQYSMNWWYDGLDALAELLKKRYSN